MLLQELYSLQKKRCGDQSDRPFPLLWFHYVMLYLMFFGSQV
jgi:hypothetical protein